MNNNITEHYCSPEVGKLLRDKGLAQVTDSGWTECPTYALAIKWIRENFGIHIFTDFGLGWEAHIVPVGYTGGAAFDNGFIRLQKNETPEEATEAALLFTLQNLIP